MIPIKYPISLMPQIWKMKGMSLTKNLLLKLLLFWARKQYVLLVLLLLMECKSVMECKPAINFLMECKTSHLWSTPLLFCLQMLLLQDIILLKLEESVSVFLLYLMYSLTIFSLKSSCSKWTHIRILRMTKATNFRLAN
jgi:hypothetical protein